jgi:hypothetical protein
MEFPDLTPVFYLAIFGLVCGFLALGGGVGWLIWFLSNHVQFV